jgi:hypothetical protein
MYMSSCGQLSHPSRAACEVIRWLNTLFMAVLEISWHLLRDKATHVAKGRVVWRQWSFFPLLFDFHVNPFNTSKQPFNLLFLQIWSIFFLLLFILFGIIYKIRIFFQFHHFSIFFIFQIWPHSFKC